MADDMSDEYDFTKARTNPYTGRLKKQVTMRLDVDTITYFKALSKRDGIPYQTLINMYLADCAANERELTVAWG
jgi:predicted DNA binding CopG/RHH family protein